MSKITKFNCLFNATVSALAFILAVTPANALPGENISTVVKWAKTRPQRRLEIRNQESEFRIEFIADCNFVSYR
jgi:hypothetical protein